MFRSMETLFGTCRNRDRMRDSLIGVARFPSAGGACLLFRRGGLELCHCFWLELLFC